MKQYDRPEKDISPKKKSGRPSACKYHNEKAKGSSEEMNLAEMTEHVGKLTHTRL